MGGLLPWLVCYNTQTDYECLKETEELQPSLHQVLSLPHAFCLQKICLLNIIGNQ